LEFDDERADCIGYPVSGFLSAANRGEGWWTTRSASLKFQAVPSGTVLAVTYWVPEFVAAEKRNLSVAIGGEPAGVVALSRPGRNTTEVSVPANAQLDSGFTIVRLDVDRPSIKDGQEYGVVLLRAAFRVTP
jgi:hypothetical protein